MHKRNHSLRLEFSGALQSSQGSVRREAVIQSPICINSVARLKPTLMHIPAPHGPCVYGVVVKDTYMIEHPWKLHRMPCSIYD